MTIAANATDPDGQVTKVEFFRADGSVKLGEDTTAPYTYQWRNPPTGDHLLRVRATDDQGASATSSAVRITVQRAGAKVGRPARLHCERSGRLDRHARAAVEGELRDALA